MQLRVMANRDATSRSTATDCLVLTLNMTVIHCKPHNQRTEAYGPLVFIFLGEYKLLLFWRSAKFKIYDTLKMSSLSYIAISHKPILILSDKRSRKRQSPWASCYSVPLLFVSEWFNVSASKLPCHPSKCLDGGGV